MNLEDKIIASVIRDPKAAKYLSLTPEHFQSTTCFELYRFAYDTRNTTQLDYDLLRSKIKDTTILDDIYSKLPIDVEIDKLLEWEVALKQKSRVLKVAELLSKKITILKNAEESEQIISDTINELIQFEGNTKRKDPSPEGIYQMRSDNLFPESWTSGIGNIRLNKGMIFTIIGGTGRNKTRTMLWSVYNCLLQNKRIIMIESEDQNYTYAAKLLSMHIAYQTGEIISWERFIEPIDPLLSVHQQSLVDEAWQWYRQQNILIIDPTTEDRPITNENIYAYIRREAKRFVADVVVVDFVQGFSRDKTYVAMANLAGSLLQAALHSDVCLIQLSQTAAGSLTETKNANEFAENSHVILWSLYDPKKNPNVIQYMSSKQRNAAAVQYYDFDIEPVTGVLSNFRVGSDD